MKHQTTQCCIDTIDLSPDSDATPEQIRAVPNVVNILMKIAAPALASDRTPEIDNAIIQDLIRAVEVQLDNRAVTTCQIPELFDDLRQEITDRALLAARLIDQTQDEWNENHYADTHDAGPDYRVKPRGVRRRTLLRARGCHD